MNILSPSPLSIQVIDNEKIFMEHITFENCNSNFNHSMLFC